MFYGVTKKKLVLANAQCEDSLTSSVFERLALLSDENLWWVLRNACDKQALAAKPLPDNLSFGLAGNLILNLSVIAHVLSLMFSCVLSNMILSSRLNVMILRNRRT